MRDYPILEHDPEKWKPRVTARHPRTGNRSHLSPRHNDLSLKIAASASLAFFDELRLFGFVEGQNLKVDGGGYGVRATGTFPVHPPGADRRRHLQEGLK